MDKYYPNLINFFIKRKKFLFVQFLIILVLTVVFAAPNFKQSHHYKIIFLNDSRSQLHFGYEESLRNSYKRIISLLADSTGYLDPRIDKKASVFGNLIHTDQKKFLDKGYSDLKNFFYIKLSRMDTENFKVELIVRNEEFDIADYQVRYNQAMREHYILQHNKFKKILDHIEEFVIERDKNYLFDDFRFAYELKLEDAIKKEKEVVKKEKEVVKKENKRVIRQHFGKALDYYMIKDQIFIFSNFYEDANKLPKEFIRSYLNWIAEKEVVKKENKRVIDDDNFFLKSICSQEPARDHLYINNLKWFYDCVLRQDFFYTKKENGENKFFIKKKMTNEFYLLISRNEIEKQIEDAIIKHKKVIPSKLETIRKKIYERIEITKKQNFIDFEYLGSNYSTKSKIIELLKYFILFYFLSFIFNTIFYFFSIRKLKNG